MSDLKLEAELAELRAEVARLKYQCEDVELQRLHMAKTTPHYLDAWIQARDRVYGLRVALERAAESLEAEGLLRSAETARRAIRESHQTPATPQQLESPPASR